MRHLLLIALAACGSKKDPPAAPQAPPVATDLASAIPADAAFAFVTLEPSDLLKRFVASLDLPAVRAAAEQHVATPDPFAHVEYAAWLELAKLPDPWKVFGARFAVFKTGEVTVARIELVDPAAAQKLVANVMGTSTIVDGSKLSELVEVAGKQLVIARGPRAAIHAFAAGAAAANPLTAAAARALGPDPRGVGWIDPKQLAGNFEDVIPACRDAVLGELRSLDRISFGISELAPARITLVATLPVAATTATALATASSTLPTLPAAITPKPIVAVSMIVPPKALRARFDNLEVACNGKPMSAPWSDIRAAALVVFDADWTFGGFFPRPTDTMFAIDTPTTGAVFTTLGQGTLGFTPPTQNGPFVRIDLGELGAVTGDIELALRGDHIIGASGPIARAHADDFKPHDHAPLLRFAIDVSHLTSPTKPLEDADFYSPAPTFAEAAGFDRARNALIGALAFELVAGTTDVHATIAIDSGTKEPPAKLAADPRQPLRDQCRLVLARGLTATMPAYAKLEVDDVDELATSYTTSLDAHTSILDCVKLTPAQRQCLLAAKNILTDAETCASGFRLPPLFSYFGPKTIDARLHPPTDASKILPKLAGTWVRKTDDGVETWVIDATGTVTATKNNKAETFKLDLHLAGQLGKVKGDTTSFEQYFQPTNDRLIVETSLRMAPIASEDHFMVPISNSYLVYDKSGCSVVTASGVIGAAKCTRDKATLKVAYSEFDAPAEDLFTLFPGCVVETRDLGEPFMRHP